MLFVIYGDRPRFDRRKLVAPTGLGVKVGTNAIAISQKGVAGRGGRAEEGDNDERDGARHQG